MMVEHAEIEITQYCGLGCDYCITPDSNTPDPFELNIDDWITGIDNLEEIGVRSVLIMGGEATRKSGIERLLAHINKKVEMDYIFLTNGFVSTALTERLIQAGIHNVGVSIDQFIEEKPAANNHSNLSKSFQGLKYLRQLRDKGVRTLFANCVVTTENIDNLTDLYESLHQEGISLNVTALQWLKYGKANPFTDNDKKRIEKVMQQLVDIKQSSGNTLINSVPYLERFTDFSVKQNYPCARLGILGFNPQGVLNYCVGAKGKIGASRRYTIGNLNYQKLLDFLEEWEQEKGTCPRCTFSCRDRSGDFNLEGKPNNFWFDYDKARL